ncbi:kunitz-type serine protease inhibitor 2 [Anastrepha obliqua]|uniref:kunitz-type serine protease inhibitor 2 n=1 Tax=Anastrepha obliqua TaxID=95512 RepID=UPI002409E25B|nr:kunitz-type serine protease inhibitor 2 [Anastrepha obliqua]
MSAQSTNVCNLPSETGHCRAAKRRYHFDADSNRCRIFIYGGCGGNGNNFRRREDCEAACLKS